MGSEVVGDVPGTVFGNVLLTLKESSAHAQNRLRGRKGGGRDGGTKVLFPRRFSQSPKSKISRR